MAFERPIEADRVDDLGFLSSFVRAPIIGPIMWILGGDVAKPKEDAEEASNCQKKNCEGKDCSDEGGAALGEGFGPEYAGDVVSSDISDSGDSSGSSVSEEDEEEDPPHERKEHLISSESSSIIVGLTRTVNKLNISRSRRKLSFSDEVPGKSLAEVRYVDEESVPHVSSASSLTRQPTKSAMKKSGSFQSNSAASKRDALASSKFVPSGIVGGKGGGVVMPSGGGMSAQQGSASVGSASGNNNGYVSPQWGWYISTTPPTPEHYYASGKGKLGKKQAKCSEDRRPPSVAEEYPMPVFKNSPTPVFRKSGAKDIFGNDNMGWPSVPL